MRRRTTAIDEDGADVAEPSPPRRPATRQDAALLGRIAHDMRAPLGMVAHTLESIGEELGSQFSDELRRTTAVAERALRRLERMADRLALLVELQDGIEPQSFRTVDLVRVIEDGVELCKAIERRREVELTTEVSEGPCSVRADPERLAFAISELVHNAMRNARRKVVVRLERVGSEGRLTIEDDGRGFSDELRELVELRFAGAEVELGGGLGLTIATQVVAAHGGRLALETNGLNGFAPGTAGARIVMWLPAYVS